jgi:integrase
MKLPRYVHGFIDRHGKPRHYVRRSGFQKIALPGVPWSPEFMAAYQEALAGQPVMPGSARVRAGSIRALTISYYGSVAFASLSRRSQYVRRGLLDRFCQEHGEKSAVTLKREHVVKLMAAKAAKPESANALRKALRALMQHAVEVGVRPDDPTRDVRAIASKTQGFHSWTDAEITQFEQKHPVGTKARLAMALLLYTGQRRSDVIRMGRQHVRDGSIHVRQAKTGADLMIPIHPELASVIAASATGRMTFLTTQFARPFTSAGFGNWFRDQCNAAGLRQCSAHGLRKAAARRLAEAGCTAHEIASITGHASLKEIARYTRGADQRRLAQSAMDKVKRRTTSG